ncbi:hypothetical protein [Dysgonomonas macrotermitis]|uniref:Lipocalin-like domain-containing protein n=1 Tax=Dysgonomonas macrotermitis TaxID=1346286 RepID=A0A1M4Y7P4_9BACT|nr:hypothetical protein [Dysgonomonas macrotermitis]SHF01738.1 hypothetical protein SAMN05444362_10396 [Dysgonomonas macrotermitis]
MNLKNLLSLFLVSSVLSTSFTACSDDDNDNDKGNIPDALVGTWKRTNVEASVEATDAEVKTQVEEFIKKMELETTTYVFKLDNTAQKKVGEEIFDLSKYELKAGKIIFSKPDTVYTDIILKDNVMTGTADVKKYVAEQLELDTTILTKAERKDLFEKVTK